MNLGDLRVAIGVNADPLKQGLNTAKAAVQTWAQEVKASEQHLAALTQQMEKEARAAQAETTIKRQQAALERELSAAKSQLTAVLAQESAAAQSVAAKYDLLSAAQRQQLVAVKEQITAQKALQDAQLQSAAAAERASQTEVAASARSAAAAEAAAIKKVAAAQKNLGRNLQTVGGGLTGAVTAPILGIAAAGIAGQVELQGAEVSAAQASGATGAQLQQLDAIIKRVAVSVPNSFKEIGRAVGELAARTGEGGAQLEKLATTELNLARITGEGAGVIRATTQAFAAWNVTAEQQIPVLDMLEKAHQLTGVKVTALASDLARSAPILKQWGLSLTDSTALLAGFERVGIGPQRLITGLATGLSRLAKAGITDAHQALGIILKDLSDTAHPMQALAEATRLFGARVGAQLVGAIRSGALSLEDLKKKLEDSGGAIAQTTKQSETFFTALNKFGHQVAVVFAPLGKVLLDMATQFLAAARPLIEQLGRLTDWFSKLSPFAKEAIVDVLLLAAAFGPVVVGIGKAITAFKEMKLAWEGVKLAFLGLEGAEGIVGSLGAIGTAVAGLSAGWIVAFAAIALVTTAFVTNFHGLRDDLVSGLRIIGGTAEKFLSGHGSSSFAEAQGDEAHRRLLMSMQDAANAGTGNRGSLNRAAASAIPHYNSPGFGESAADIRAKLDSIGAGKAKETPLAKEQTRYTEELTQAHAKLKELLAGEDNIAAQVAARYHLLTAAQRENLTAVLQEIKTQTELRQSQKQYGTDMGKLNAEIRRLKQGHDAEASGVDALREKYPGLSTAMLTAMNNAIQWKKHLQELQAEAHKAAEEVRGFQLRILTAGTDNRTFEAADRLFGPRLLAQGKKPQSARDLYEHYLTAPQQLQANQAANTGAFADLDEAIKSQRQQYEQRVGASGAVLNPGARAAQTRFGVGYQEGLTGESVQVLQDKIARLLEYERVNRRIDALLQAQAADQAAYDQVIGTSTFNLEKLQEQFGILSGKSQMARDVLAQFGVNLARLPQETQATVRQMVELSRSMQFLQEFRQGIEQQFNQMFEHLYEHGFKGFFKSVTQGFEQMLQQMAARYLASQLANLVQNTIGGALGSIFGSGARGGGISGASLGNIFGLPGRAGGGAVRGGSTYLVGERGPELFTPRASGAITPNAQLAGAGGGNVTIHMTVNTPDATSFRRNSGAIAGDLQRHLESRRRRDG